MIITVLGTVHIILEIGCFGATVLGTITLGDLTEILDMDMDIITDIGTIGDHTIITHNMVTQFLKEIIMDLSRT